MLATRLERAFIEYIHDVLVSLWMPFDERIDPNEYKDLALLESSVARPFQTFGGEDLFPTIPHKAAALFHGLVCNHCFNNGNKRTAVIALDFFLLLNGRMMAISNRDIYDIATETAIANRDGVPLDTVLNRLTIALSEQSVVLAEIKNLDPESSVAKELGPERLKKVTDRVDWLTQMLQKLLHKMRTESPPSTRN